MKGCQEDNERVKLCRAKGATQCRGVRKGAEKKQTRGAGLEPDHGVRRPTSRPRRPCGGSSQCPHANTSSAFTSWTIPARRPPAKSLFISGSETTGCLNICKDLLHVRNFPGITLHPKKHRNKTARGLYRVYDTVHGNRCHLCRGKQPVHTAAKRGRKLWARLTSCVLVAPRAAVGLAGLGRVHTSREATTKLESLRTSAGETSRHHHNTESFQ